MSQIPQGFLDQVNSVFSLKTQAEASAQAQTDAGTALDKARDNYTAASSQATQDATDLANARKALETLEDVYFTVGGTLPAPAQAAPITPPPIPAPSTNGTPVTQGA